METFLAYFDILGFKEFIDNSTPEIKERLMNALMRDSQSAVSRDKYIPKDAGTFVPDLSAANIHCLHISDSILFWTEDTSSESFIEMVNCCQFFLLRCLQITFPVRGCMVAGEITFQPFTMTNAKNVAFHNSSLYGKALIDAYLKAESQDWAGCYIDKSAIAKVDDKVVSDLIYNKKLVYYPVPFKNEASNNEFAVRTIPKTINDVYFKNLATGLEGLFTRHMGGKPMPDSVKRKLTNSIKFYDYFRENTSDGRESNAK